MLRRSKRVFSWILVIMLLPSLLAVPSYADELEWINVLDYALPNNSTSTLVSLTAGTNDIYFYLPYSVNVANIDIVVRQTSQNMQMSFRGSKSLNKLIVSEGYATICRFYGFGGGYQTSTIHIQITTPNDCTVIFEKFFVSTLLFDDFQDVGKFVFSYDSETIEKSMTSPGTGVNHLFGSSNVSTGIKAFTLSFSCPNWKKYDYIDFYFTIRAKTINSISALFGTEDISLTLNEVYDGGNNQDTWTIVARLDLSNIDRTVSAVPEVFVTGSANDYYGTNFISLVDVVGFVSSGVDSELHFFRSWFDQIVNRLTSIDNQLLDLESIGVNIFEISEAVKNLPTAIGQLLNSQTASIESALVGLQDGIRGMFTSLNGWITSQTTSLKNALASEFTSLKELLNTLLRQDTTSSEEFQEQVSTQATELEGIAGELEEVTKPPVDDLPIGVDQYVNSGDIAQIGNGLSGFFEGSIFFPMIMISMICSLGSVVIYGKRG